MKYFLSFILICCGLAPSYAQSEDVKQVEQTILNLFDGMRAGDSMMVHLSFYNDARMQTSFINEDGTAGFSEGSLARFLNAVGTPHEAVWDERIKNLKVVVDDNLAHAWMDYSFYLGGAFSHCGVNAMQLVKMDGDWKIVNIIDTRRKENCQ